MSKNSFKEISKFLRLERKNNNITLEELSYSSNISYNAIWNIENGRDFKMSTFIKICDFYGLDISKIFTHRDLKNNSKLSLNEKQLEKLQDFIKSIEK